MGHHCAQQKQNTSFLHIGLCINFVQLLRVSDSGSNNFVFFQAILAVMKIERPWRELERTKSCRIQGESVGQLISYAEKPEQANERTEAAPQRSDTGSARPDPTAERPGAATERLEAAAFKRPEAIS